MSSVGIVSEAYYFPPTKKLVADIFKDENIPIGTLAKNIDFQRDIGIDYVYVTDEMPSTLAIRAAKKALDKSGIRPGEVDLVVDFTSIPEDYPGPTWSSAGLIQEELGLTNAYATAVNTGGCASYHVAMKAVIAIMKSRDNINVALLAAGDRTPKFNKAYYPITVASDGGAAFILKKNSDRANVLGVETISIGRLHDVWYVPGLQNRTSDEIVTEDLLHMYANMDKFNEHVIPINFLMFRKVVNRLLARMRMTLNEVNYFIYPTFSTWDQESFMRFFKVAPEKVYTKGLRSHGHVQESDMVINYMDAVNDGNIKNGDNVMLISNGAGFAWSAALVRH